MRLNINEVVYGINFTYKDRLKNNTNLFFSMPNNINGNREVETIRLTKLVVTEHHRVPSEWDEKQEHNCDGYLLKDEKGVEWRNQWPVAHHGQLTDTGNRRYKLKEPADKTAKEDFENKLESGEIPVYEYHQLQDVLTTFQESIEKMEGTISGLNDGSLDASRYIPLAEIEKTRQFHVDLIKRITDQFAKDFPGQEIRLEKQPSHEGSKILWWSADITTV